MIFFRTTYIWFWTLCGLNIENIKTNKRVKIPKKSKMYLIEVIKNPGRSKNHWSHCMFVSWIMYKRPKIRRSDQSPKIDRKGWCHEGVTSHLCTLGTTMGLNFLNLGYNEGVTCLYLGYDETLFPNDGRGKRSTRLLLKQWKYPVLPPSDNERG